MGPLKLCLLLVSGFALQGCIASMAASAVGAAVSAATAEPERVVTEDRRDLARQACSARAAQQGSVNIIDADQRSDGLVTVWGTVEAASGRRSFECHFKDKVTGFRLREIRRKP